MFDSDFVELKDPEAIPALPLPDRIDGDAYIMAPYVDAEAVEKFHLNVRSFKCLEIKCYYDDETVIYNAPASEITLEDLIVADEIHVLNPDDLDIEQLRKQTDIDDELIDIYEKALDRMFEGIKHDDDLELSAGTASKIPEHPEGGSDEPAENSDDEPALSDDKIESIVEKSFED